MKEQSKVIELNKKKVEKQTEVYEFERFNEAVITVKKHNLDGYMLMGECGVRRLLEISDYAFMDSSDADDQTHYFIATSESDEDQFDTFYELELEPFYELVALFLNQNNIELLLSELHHMEITCRHEPVLEHGPDFSDIEDRKIEIITPQQDGIFYQFKYKCLNEAMKMVNKYDFEGYSIYAENGYRLYFQYDGYALFESVDINGDRHFWVGLSYWNKEHPDTFFELDLDNFFDFINLYIGGRTPELLEELKVIEFGGKLLDHINKKVNMTND